MSLARVPRLWPKRYTYLGWRDLPENKNLDEKDAIILFEHEERRYNAYEEELYNQYANRQATLVNQINQLDTFIFDTLTPPSRNTNSIPYVEAEGGGYNDLRHLRDSAVDEILTENGLFLILEDGNIVGPYPVMYLGE